MDTFVIARPDAALNRYMFLAGFAFQGMKMQPKFVAADNDTECLIAAMYPSREAAQAAIDQCEKDEVNVAGWMPLPAKLAWTPVVLNW